MKNIILLFGIICLSIDFSFAQSVTTKGSLYVDITIPTNERNRAFEQTMEGLFHGSIGYQQNVYKGLTVGAGVNYTYFTMNRFAFNSSIGTGGAHLPAVHLKVGYEKFTTDRVSLYGGLKVGYGSLIAMSDSCLLDGGNGRTEHGSLFVSPQIELNFLTELGSADAFSALIGYSIYFQEYNSSYLCRSTFPGFLPEHSEGLLRFLNFGFGYKYYFGK
ncbi:hypothetical protein DNU06_11115 [Putridiphycobacter roseus]|uniref:Outer membrane protein beta-barrel domain-containing protein n=1 Tax=Putridiphycobacter roseus TaxID=2219161 RepID=A0A2W1MXC6_9FLAO|nr:hypothetical protein [Putridiphycobacter roseus]PZE16799.1 hypothetical protein DNU06_11115 [Putridiphycobacter roseus]